MKHWKSVDAVDERDRLTPIGYLHFGVVGWGESSTSPGL